MDPRARDDALHPSPLAERNAHRRQQECVGERFWEWTSSGSIWPAFREVGSAWATSAILGYSRELETEADEQGLEEVVEAGYDPSAVFRVFEYLREEEEQDGEAAKHRPATHPEISERVAHCRELLATRYADAIAAGGRIGRDEYLAHIPQVLLDNAALDEAANRLEFARRAVDKYIAEWPDRAPGYFARGELCQQYNGTSR